MSFTDDPFGNFDLSGSFDASSSSTYVWPTGFTPEHLPSVSAVPSAGHFINFTSLQQPTGSASMDAKILGALEGQTAFIEGDPDGQDLELFYYRMVSRMPVNRG